jgi:hypothetical protein
MVLDITRGYQMASAPEPVFPVYWAPWPAQGRRTPTTDRYDGVSGVRGDATEVPVCAVAYSHRRYPCPIKTKQPTSPALPNTPRRPYARVRGRSSSRVPKWSGSWAGASVASQPPCMSPRTSKVRAAIPLHRLRHSHLRNRLSPTTDRRGARFSPGRGCGLAARGHRSPIA